MLVGSFKMPADPGGLTMSPGVGDVRPLLVALLVTNDMVVPLLEELLADGPAASLLPSVVVELLLILKQLS